MIVFLFEFRVPAVKLSSRLIFWFVATTVFRPLDKSSQLIQSWLMFMVAPLVFDIFAFGLRCLSLCNLSA